MSGLPDLLAPAQRYLDSIENQRERRVFAALTAMVLTAATGLLCALSLALRGNHPAAVLVWLAVGSFGGFSGGLGFAWLLSQLRDTNARQAAAAEPPGQRSACTLSYFSPPEARGAPEDVVSPAPPQMPAGPDGHTEEYLWTEHDRLAPHEGICWEALAAWADSGWTFGVAAVVTLDLAGMLVSDEASIWSALVPVLTACFGLAWGFRQLRGRKYFTPRRTGLALLCGLLGGLCLTAAWVGLGDLLRGTLAVVVGVHLAVTLAVLSHP